MYFAKAAEETWSYIEHLLTEECGLPPDCGIKTERPNCVNAIKNALEARDDFRWLIEAPGLRYLAVQRLSQSDSFVWTTNHNEALAFRSQEQADAMMMALRQMDRLHDSYKNHGKLSWGELFAFEPTVGNAKAVEHCWMSDAVPFGMTAAK